MKPALAAMVTASALTLVLAAQGPGADGRYNRDCLVSAAEQYLDALAAILERVPYGMTSGWSSWEDGMSDRIQWQGK